MSFGGCPKNLLAPDNDQPGILYLLGQRRCGWHKASSWPATQVVCGEILQKSWILLVHPVSLFSDSSACPSIQHVCPVFAGNQHVPLSIHKQQLLFGLSEQQHCLKHQGPTFWCRRHPTTASCTLGKNHFSPTLKRCKFYSPSDGKSAEIPTGCPVIPESAWLTNPRKFSIPCLAYLTVSSQTTKSVSRICLVV